MNMKTVIIVIALFLQYGCAKPDSSQGDSGKSTDAQSVSGGVKPDSCEQVSAQQFYEPIPGFYFGSPFHFRSDRYYVHKNTGESRRAIVLEVLSGDVESTVSTLDKSLARAGFKPVGEAGQGSNGSVTRRYAKEGFGAIYTEVSPGVGNFPSDKRAVGVVTISWKASV